MKTIATIAASLFAFLFLAVSMPVQAEWKSRKDGWIFGEKVIYVEGNLFESSQDGEELPLEDYISLVIYCRRGIIAVESNEGFFSPKGKGRIYPVSIEFDKERYVRFANVEMISDKQINIGKIHSMLGAGSGRFSYHHFLKMNTNMFIQMDSYWHNFLHGKEGFFYTKFDISGYEPAFHLYCG